MKLDIPYYIRQVLREQRMVHIPGIGTFRLNQSAASFNDDKTELSPPSLNLSFDDSESEDDSLLKYILDTGLLTEAKAKKKLDQYTQSAFNKLLNVDSFQIDGVGTIAKKSGQDKVQFEPSLPELTREFSDLGPLELSPIARIAEQQPAAIATEVKPEVEDSGSFIPRILLLALLFIALWFLGNYLYDAYTSRQIDEKSELVEPSVLEKEATVDVANEKELEKKYGEIDDLIDPLSDDKATEKTADNTSKVDEELSNLTEQPETKEEEVKKSDVAAVGEPEIDDKIEDGVASKSVETETETEPSKPANKHADILPESGECIIVVGSFIKSLNAIKMVSLLERKGYNVYQSEYKGFKRVGLKYECVDEDLETYLHQIRKKISKKAWYLDPSLDVPYQKK